MRRSIPLLICATLVGCQVDAEQPQGIQIGEEEIAQPDPCEWSETDIASDEPVLDGASVDELLGQLPLVADAEPTWDDGAARTVHLDLAWDGGPLVLMEESGPDPECDSPPRIPLSLEGRLWTDDGLLDEALSVDTALAGPGLGLSVEIDAAAVGGTVDTDALVADVTGGAVGSSYLDVMLFLDPGDFGGVITAIGWEGDPQSSMPVEHEIALW